MHSPMYERILSYYLFGFWNVAHVRFAVQRKYITEDEFVEITGAVYE